MSGSAVATRIVPFPPKLVRPRVDGRSVARSRLLDRLDRSSASEVVVSAPAGYGKSTLVAQWADTQTRPLAWLSIDEADNDPVVLLTYLALALDSLEPIAEPTRAALLGEPLEWPDLLARSLDELATRPPSVLVLDDVHRLEGPSRTIVLDELRAHVPDGSSLVMTTREGPPLPTARSTVSGRMLVVDASDLAMTLDEATALLDAAGLTVPADAACELTVHTEGWPAGLYLAALALRGRDDPVAAVREFTGADRAVVDYFAEEVLPALPPDDLEFLLATSGLRRLSGPLCDAALDRPGSAGTLERLARANRFVVALDRTGEWFRYHHLFAEVLRAEAIRRAPARAAVAARRASDWCSAHDDPDGAVMLALAADEPEHAAALVWEAAPSHLGSRRAATVDRWLAAFTPAQLERVPALAVTAAWRALERGDIHGVHRYAAAAELGAPGVVLPDGTPAEASVALLRAITATGSLEQMRDNAARAVGGHPVTSPYRVVALFLEGAALTLLDELDPAEEQLREGARIGAVLLPSGEVQCLAQLASVAMVRGRVAEAEALVDRAVARVEEHTLSNRPAIGLVFATAALVLHARGRHDAGESARAAALDLLPRIEDLSPYQTLAGHLQTAAASVVAGDLAGAQTLLEESARRLARLRSPGVLPDWLAQVRQIAAEASPRPPGTAAPIETLTPAELRVLVWLPTHMSFGEIGTELFLSRNTVKSHAMAIYRKLGVTSRSGAVKEAQALGLLDR